MQTTSLHNQIGFTGANVKPVHQKRPISTSSSQLSCNEDEDWRSTRFFYLPKELWLKILVNYGITATDLSNLDRSCKWFSFCCQGEKQ